MKEYDWDKLLPIVIAGQKAGKSYATLQREMGIPQQTLRDRHAVYRGIGRIRTGRVNHYVTDSIKMSEIRRLKALRPPDTRDLSARLCGEPRPGESALARMKAAGA